MEKKKLLLIIFGVILFIVILVLILFKAFNNEKSDKMEACNNIVGGGFYVNYVTNNDDIILDPVLVCIACGPDTYEDLPVINRDNYNFLGWYYDEEFKEKVDGESTLDINPIANTSKDGCVIGYKDITLYARWEDKNIEK